MRILLFLFLLFGAPLAAQDLGDPIQTAVKERDYTRALEKARLGAERGEAKAQGDLGLMYQKGLGVDQDMKKAAYWLGKAARRGDASAENNFGVLYFNGDSLPQDYVQARQWFEKAAAQGLSSSQCNLGLLYGAGLGVPKDFTKALTYYQQAADQDDPDAEVSLGMMFNLGEGTPQDNAKAYFWFDRALLHDLDEDKRDEVRDDIQWLEKHMDGKTVAEAKKKAEHWKPPTAPTSSE